MHTVEATMRAPPPAARPSVPSSLQQLITRFASTDILMQSMLHTESAAADPAATLSSEISRITEIYLNQSYSRV